jgi:hypothetical protein
MKEPVLAGETNRRDMLRLSGMGALAGMAAGALTAGPARAEGEIKAAAGVTLAYASWIHGHSMQIENPDRVTSVWRAGFYISLLPAPGISTWCHFAIPTPVIINDVRLRADSVMLCFKTGCADAWINAVGVYDGSTLIAFYDKLKMSGDHPFERFAVPNTPAVGMGIGISIGISCGVEQGDLDHSMQFIAAGCDFKV